MSRRPLPRAPLAALLAVCAASLLSADDPARRNPEPLPAGPQTAPAVPRPQDPGSEKVLAYVAYPKLDATLQTVEGIAQAFAPPGAMQPGTIKKELGGEFGDPDLAALNLTRPVVAMLFKASAPDAEPPFAMFIPVRNPAPYAAKLGTEGFQTKESGGVLMAAHTPESLAEAEGALAAYRQIEAAGIQADVRAYVNVTRTLAVYQPIVQKGLDEMLEAFSHMPGAMPAPGGAPGAAPAGAAGIKAILAAELKTALGLLQQIDEIQIDARLDLNAAGGSMIVVAKPGSALAELLTASVAGPGQALSLLSEPGFLSAAYQIDPRRSVKFAQQILDTLAKDPDCASLITPDVRAFVSDLATWSSGQGAFAVRSTKTSPFTMESAAAVADDAKAMAMADKMMALFGPDGAVAKLYADLGMPFSVTAEKDERKHGGVSVNRIKFSLDAQKLPDPAQGAMMGAMVKDIEFAIAKGWYLSSQDPASLDAMIDRALSGQRNAKAALQAMGAFGKERHFYADYDFVALMKAMSDFMPGAGGAFAARQKAAFAKLKPGDAMTFAGTLAGGRAELQARIPFKPFVDMAKAMMGGGGDDDAPAPDLK